MTTPMMSQMTDPTPIPAPAPENPPFLNEYDVDKLPESYRALLREEMPIPTTTLFIPRHRTWTNVALTLVVSTTSIVFGLLLMVAWFFLDQEFNSHGVASTSYFSWVLCAGLLFVLGGGLWAYSVRTKVRGIRAERAGRPLRYGLFLTPAGVLERRDVGFTMVPRERIRSLDLDESRSVRVTFTAGDGAERATSLESSKLGDSAIILDTMRRWMATPQP